MKVKISDFRVILMEVTEEHPKYYHTVLVEYHFYGDNLEGQKIKKSGRFIH
jgi:putative redox protein